MSDPDALARRAYEAFYAALETTWRPLDWTRLRPVVQQAWRVVVAVVREAERQEDDHA